MAVTIAQNCFNAQDPVDPPWEEIEDPREATGHYAEGWEAEPRFRVETDTVERAAAALLVVAERFMRVGESGTEYGESDEFPDDRDWTPSNASVSVDDEAAYVRATTEFLSHEMAETMKFILIQELTSAGVDAVVTADYNPIRGIRARPWPRER